MTELKNVTLHWREDGDPHGTPVVFANSLGTDLRLWDKIIPLMPKGFRLIRFDKRGHGLSSCPGGPYSIQNLTDDTVQLLDLLGVKSCVFVGLSIGGMIGQQLAFERPELVRAVVLSNTAAKMGTTRMWQDRITALHAGGIEPLADGIMEHWFSEGFRETPELIGWRNLLTRTPLPGYIGCCHAIARADLTNATEKLILPVLGIGGSEDLACPSEMTEKTTGMVTGSRFVVINGVGHLPCVEKPENYAKLVGDFILEHGNV